MAATRIYRTAGLVLTEHEFMVPLDHDRPDGRQLTVFGREIGEVVDEIQRVFYFVRQLSNHRAATADLRQKRVFP